jgi:hypothetical protein
MVMSYIQQIPALAPILAEADHIDVKVVEGRQTLREFMAGMMSYQPAWVTFLYGVRAVFVRFLGMKQPGIPRSQNLSPSDIPMSPGKRLLFFKVRVAKEDEYLVAEIKDTHLDAMLGVVVEPLSGELKRFHVLTIVNYNNWAGPIYFNVIRPFHHLVVGGMARAGLKGHQAVAKPSKISSV